MTNFDDKAPALKTWQFFRAARAILGIEFLTKLYQRGSRQIFRWSADPDFAEQTDRNPLDRFIIVFQRLDEVGRRDMAEAALGLMASAIECEVCRVAIARPDKPTIEAECLDDYPELVAFHKLAMATSADPDLVRYAWQKAKGEIDETYAYYVAKSG